MRGLLWLIVVPLLAAGMLPLLPMGEASAVRSATSSAPSLLPSGPALASPRPGRLVLFERAAGGGLTERQFTNGGWGKVSSLGGRSVSGPAVASDSAGHLIVVIGGRNGRIQLSSSSGRGWSRWLRLPGKSPARPAITAVGRRIFRIVIRDMHGRAMAGTWRLKNRTFSGWSSLGGRLTSAPAVAIQPSGVMTVAALGQRGQLMDMTVTPAGKRSAWASLGGTWAGAPALASDRTTGALHLAVRDQHGVVQVRTRPLRARKWDALQAIAGHWPASPALVSAIGGLTLMAEQNSAGVAYQSFLDSRWTSFSKVTPLTVTKRTTVLRPGQVTAVQGPPDGQQVITLADGVHAPATGTILALGVTGATPDGLLAQVISTSAGPGGTTLATTNPASLTSAVSNASIDLAAALSAADIASGATASGNYQPAAVTPSQVAPAFRAAAQPTLAQKIKKNFSCSASVTASITGAVSVSPSFSLTAHWGSVSVKDASFSGTVTEDAELTASITAAASCDLDKTPLLASPIVFRPIVFNVGPIPVVIIPELQLYLTASGNVTAQISAQAGQQATATAGLTWSKGTLSRVAGWSNSFSQSTVPPAQGLSGQAGAAVGPALSLLVYGVAGPQFTAAASIELDVAPASTPWWELIGGLDAGARLVIPPLGIDKGDDSIIHYRHVLAQASSVPVTAYVGGVDYDNITPISVANNKAGTPIKVAAGPEEVVFTPDGKTAYVPGFNSTQVTPISTITNKAGKVIKVGSHPDAVAITPNGKTAYVVNSYFGISHPGTVTPINTATNTPGREITVGAYPAAIVITPAGKTAYIMNWNSSSVTPIDTGTNLAGAPIKITGGQPIEAITPSGKTLYVVSSNSVTPISTATNKAGAPIKVGTDPIALALTPDGKTLYVLNYGSTTQKGSVTPISTATNKAGKAFTVGWFPVAITLTPDGTKGYICINDSVIPFNTATHNLGTAINVRGDDMAFTPDGTTLYIGNNIDGTVTPIRTTTNTVGTPIPVGGNDSASFIAISP
jgi:YVTN family beta-propeller protein